MVELAELEEQDAALLYRLAREHEEKTASPRARRLLVQWEQSLALFKKVVPKNARQLVVAAREAYLQSAPSEPELVLERRSA
ncbi:MAG TPA: hypothetical protein VFP28_08555, partial [Gemmatimonadales bacterium]|nr:hypothetical protein [Gemmatimonadales bacterium]